ncbi:biotin--[acetyl-CoA-carboxylase] ligase [Corynebacterium sp. P7003]|uniref:biotin--[biotin carboxyl-carrier protein] ligase n=1 Tax=Corynebacterium pygosceleis TaxID=2800406 RepID=A0ABT3WRE1_9CORY|nr:biotin--[acetyl-CoA-carboxylase] ligase [Corynebacterium pygosceleis]MCX7444780.1 biotin--[acetyl-CoA-carboxylase] ligase [Corynebacterium pygosceleis]
MNSRTPRTQVDTGALHRRCVTGGPYARIVHTGSTGSTNADLVAASSRGAPEWTAVIAEHQSAGRGRHGRVWTAPEGSQVIVSVLIRPSAPGLVRLGTLPLAAGLAVIDAVTAAADRAAAETGSPSPLQPVLKWPNDVLLGGRKLCGILAEAANLSDAPAVVVGLGINVSLTEDELPVPHAVSLDLAAPGHTFDRTLLTGDVLLALHHRLTQWAAGDPGLLADYRDVCSSIGARAKVLIPAAEGERTIYGTVTGVADDGRLLFRDEDGNDHELAAGDVTHLRPV